MLFLLANTYIGAIIDRYSVEAYIPNMICVISIVISIVNIVNYKKINVNKSKKKESKSNG